VQTTLLVAPTSSRARPGGDRGETDRVRREDCPDDRLVDEKTAAKSYLTLTPIVRAK
jgi:hypothetical protein